MKLIIGNKAYSSWSLRAWLAMRHTGIDFEEIRIPLYAGDMLALLTRLRVRFLRSMMIHD